MTIRHDAVKHLFYRAFIVGASLFLLTGCFGIFAKKPDTSQVCISECPDLTTLRDDTFGATTSKLKEVADTYYNCRAACQGPKK